MITIPRWAKGFQALSQSFDTGARTIRAFFHYNLDEEHMDLIEHLRIVPDKAAYRHPLFLPSYLFQHHRKQVESYRRDVDYSILNIEHSIGYAVPGNLGAAGRWQSEMLELSGLETFVRKLHTYKTELGAVSLEATFGKGLGAFLINLEHELDATIPQEGTELWKVSEDMRHIIDFNTNLHSTIYNQAEILKVRADSHINLVSTPLFVDTSFSGLLICERLLV